MTRNEDLNKLFEAALSGKPAPSRFGNPEAQRKFSPLPAQSDGAALVQENRIEAFPTQAVGDLEPPTAQQIPPAPAPNSVSNRQYQFVPVPAPTPRTSAFEQPASPPVRPAPTPQPEPAFQKFASDSPFSKPQQVASQPQPRLVPMAKEADPAPQSPFIAAASPVQASPSGDLVTLDDRAKSSLESGLSEELGAILDAKIARTKRQRRRGLVITILVLLALVGGATGWIVTNPERYNAMKGVLAEIKSVGDIKGMVEKYQKALDNIGERGRQIDDASSALGVDPTTVDEHADGGFDKEMKDMMGEDGGPTAASRNAKLQEKFKDVQENGSLLKNGSEDGAGSAE